ncbi:fatty-acyl-CoA synthase [Biscogniauxia mediterranea]|nr:fatty-acyl-CoA synthase [Biscogniauxia mediterranea]
MSLAIAGAVAGGAALAAYLDAKFHIRNDIKTGSRQLNQFLLTRTVLQRARENKLLIYSFFEERAGTAAGDNTFLIFEGREWTYTEFYEALQPVGNWLMKDLGIQKGEVVAVDGGNSPEYLMLWFALEAIGAIPAFVNSHLTAQPLIHSIKVCGARYVLVDEGIQSLVAPVEEELKSINARVIYYNPALFESFTDTETLPSSRHEGFEPLQTASLMYTSGTTGLPKAVVLTRAREMGMSLGRADVLPLKPGDRMYTCLPLYHGAAHGLCVAPCVGNGAAVVLSRKFSHKTFWPEVHASRATHIQYVGELCRYLVNAAPGPLDRGHSVRMAWGNGMRPDVWERFRERFGIECINELYAATDGMLFCANANRGPFTRGAIALRGPLWHLLNGRGERRARIDPDTQELARGADGLCAPGEPGETLARMDAADPDRGTPTYFGNHEAAVRRRASGVFAPGDLWFRSGDVMRLDAEGRLYFVDRLGDTFRWRSENVSTSEVADAVGLFPRVAEANVYGVLVPNADGRAGCAAVVLRDGEGDAGGKVAFDWEEFTAHCRANLPRYALPLFVRVVRQLEYTGTMKMQKGRLRSEGIDLDAIEQAAKDRGEEAADTMYWLPPGEKSTYVPFTKRDLQELRAGRVRL